MGQNHWLRLFLTDFATEQNLKNYIFQYANQNDYVLWSCDQESLF